MRMQRTEKGPVEISVISQKQYTSRYAYLFYLWLILAQAMAADGKQKADLQFHLGMVPIGKLDHPKFVTESAGNHGIFDSQLGDHIGKKVGISFCSTVLPVF